MKEIVLVHSKIHSTPVRNEVRTYKRMNAVPYHTQLLQDALQEAAAQKHDVTAPETIIHRSISACKHVCVQSPTGTLMVTGLLAIVLIIVLRPPFALVYEHDSRYPWRGKLSISWFSVLVAALITVAVAAGIPLVSSGVF